MKSEEQWVEVGECEGCNAVIYKMGDRYRSDCCCNKEGEDYDREHSSYNRR